MTHLSKQTQQTALAAQAALSSTLRLPPGFSALAAALAASRSSTPALPSSKDPADA